MLVPERIYSGTDQETRDIVLPVSMAAPMMCNSLFDILFVHEGPYTIYPASLILGFPVWMALVWLWEPVVPAGGFRGRAGRALAYAMLILISAVLGIAMARIYRAF